MREIPLGTKGTFTMRVEPAHLANQFKDAMLPPVLATPMMILMMENAALNAIRPYLEPGESAVGTAINIRHLAATPVGHTVRAEAEVIKVEGKRIEFTVSATDELEDIGNGTHARTLINLRSFNERLATKSKLGHPQKLTTILQSFSAHKEWRHQRRYVRLPSPSRTPTRLDRKSLSNKTKSLSLGRLPHVL